MADETKEIMSQEEIDAYIASVRTSEEKEQQQPPQQQEAATDPAKEMPASDTGTDKPKEIMSQEEIDAYIASVRASEEKEEQQEEEQPPQQNTSPEPRKENSASDNAAGGPKEIMSQEEIDAYIASVRAKEEKEQQTVPEINGPKENSNTSGAVSQDDIDDLVSQQHEPEAPALRKDSGAVSQKDIDNLISQQQVDETQSEAEKFEEDRSQDNNDSTPTQQQEQKQEASAEAETSGDVSQDDIDALLEQQQGQEQEPPAETETSGDASQDDIDALLEQQQEPEQEPPAEAEASGEVSQDDIDALLTQQQEQVQEGPKPNLSQDEVDALSSDQGSGITGANNDSWEELGSDILSQDEINALLSGLSEPEDSPASNLDTGIAEQGKEFSDSVNDIDVSTREEHIERQKKKEERIIQNKSRAAAMIRELLRMEKKRINLVQVRKNKMINDDLYSRYEITRADRSKITVSISDKTAAQYHSSHPGCDMFKI